MFRFPCVLFTFLLSFFVFSSQIEAAEIKMQSKHSRLIISGKIEPGDYLKFRKTLKDKGASPIWPIVLHSAGGDVIEAMKIGRLIRKLRLETEAPYLILTKPPQTVCYQGRVEPTSTSKCICTSACFFIFIAGVGRTGNILGIHRPYIAPERAKQLTLNKTISEYEGVRKIVVNYLNEMNRAYPVDAGIYQG